MASGMSFNLIPTLEQCCQDPTHRLMAISGRDAESTEFITSWSYWCPQCQALTMTRQAAETALSDLPKDAIGVVTQVPLRLATEP